MSRWKTVQAIGHSFDGLAAHITVEGRGAGGTLRVATMRAVNIMLGDPKLRHKHINDFKISVVVIADKKGGGS